MGMMLLFVHPQYIMRPKKYKQFFNSFIKNRRSAMSEWHIGSGCHLFRLACCPMGSHADISSGHLLV